MSTIYTVEGKYANGDDHADKFDNLHDVAMHLEYIADENGENASANDDERILSAPISITTEKQ